MNNSKEIQWGKHAVSRRWLLSRFGAGVGEIGLGLATRSYNPIASSATIDAGLLTLFATFRSRYVKKPDPILSGGFFGMVSLAFRKSQIN